MYDESIKRKVDLFNVQSADYKDYRKEIKEKSRLSREFDKIRHCKSKNRYFITASYK